VRNYSGNYFGDLRSILSLFKNKLAGFQGMQSGKIVFVARACNIHSILHLSCLVET